MLDESAPDGRTLWSSRTFNSVPAGTLLGADQALPGSGTRIGQLLGCGAPSACLESRLGELLCSIAGMRLGPRLVDMSTTTPRYLGIQGRGTIALPADVRRRMHLDEPGAQLEMVEREDGVLELRAALPIPADQRWFWTDRWQEREREVGEHVEAGRVTTHESTEDFLDHLDDLDRE